RAQMATAKLERRLPLSRSAERSCRVHRLRLSAALCYPIARPRRCPPEFRWTVLRRPLSTAASREITNGGQTCRAAVSAAGERDGVSQKRPTIHESAYFGVATMSDERLGCH